MGKLINFMQTHDPKPAMRIFTAFLVGMIVGVLL